MILACSENLYPEAVQRQVCHVNSSMKDRSCTWGGASSTTVVQLPSDGVCALSPVPAVLLATGPSMSVGTAVAISDAMVVGWTEYFILFERS